MACIYAVAEPGISDGRIKIGYSSDPAYRLRTQTACRDDGFSRPMFYKLRRQGKAPRITKVGRVTRVGTEAAAERRAGMAQESPEQAQ